MHPADCPAYDYEDHPDAKKEVPERCETLLLELRTDTDRFSQSTFDDCRGCHGRMFAGLTPEGYDYFAGNWRGSRHRCLRDYGVGVKSDALVGIDPRQVANAMAHLSASLKRSKVGFSLLQSSQFSATVRLKLAANLAAYTLEAFLRVHPFANGNGHVGRLLVLCVLGVGGFWPASWPVDRHPPGNYGSYLYHARRGGHDELVKYILRCVAGTESSPKSPGDMAAARPD